MTIGPEPMIKTLLTSVLLGTSLAFKQGAVAELAGSLDQFIPIRQLQRL